MLLLAQLALAFVAIVRCLREGSERRLRTLRIVLGVMNIAYLPSVQLGLAVLGCTDAREKSEVYINLEPYQVRLLCSSRSD